MTERLGACRRQLLATFIAGGSRAQSGSAFFPTPVAHGSGAFALMSETAEVLLPGEFIMKE